MPRRTVRSTVPKRLVRAAVAARRRAYAPYSKFAVGAAVLAADGTVFTGCNVENASYGLSVCAERVAILTAVAAGRRRLRAATTPCGACRQVMDEFGVETVILAPAGRTPAAVPLRELLPLPFAKRALRGRPRHAGL